MVFGDADTFPDLTRVRDGKVTMVTGDYFTPITKKDIGSLDDSDFEAHVTPLPADGSLNQYLPNEWNQYPNCYRKIMSSNRGKKETIWVREDVFVSSWDDNMDYSANEENRGGKEWLKSQIRTAKDFSSSPNNKILSGELYCSQYLLDALIGSEGNGPETMKGVIK